MDKSEVPPTGDLEYEEWLLSWLEENRGPSYDAGIRVRRYLKDHEGLYDSYTKNLVDRTAQTPFWKTLLSDLAEQHYAYKIRTKHPLLMHGPPLTAAIEIKPWDSLVEKSWRKNIVHNKVYPEPPEGGWYTPANWYQRIGDIIRTNIVVTYLDGVQVVVDRVVETAVACGLHQPKVTPEAHDDGYYAMHVDVRLPLKVPDHAGQLREEEFSLEVQVSTQVQDVIHALTHSFYSSARRKARDPEHVWQWDYNCKQFTPNYLGHVLHYVEGMIMQIRERQEGQGGE